MQFAPASSGHGEDFCGQAQDHLFLRHAEGGPAAFQLEGEIDDLHAGSRQYPVHRDGVLGVVEAGDLRRPVEYAPVVGGDPQVRKRRGDVARHLIEPDILVDDLKDRFGVYRAVVGGIEQAVHLFLEDLVLRHPVMGLLQGGKAGGAGGGEGIGAHPLHDGEVAGGEGRGEEVVDRVGRGRAAAAPIGRLDELHAEALHHEPDRGVIGAAVPSSEQPS